MGAPLEDATNDHVSRKWNPLGRHGDDAVAVMLGLCDVEIWVGHEHLLNEIRIEGILQ